MDEKETFLLDEINLFGPEIVKKIGRNRLSAIEAHIIEDLDDGGMLIIPMALNEENYYRKYVDSGKYRLPIEPEIIEWYEQTTGLKREPPVQRKKGFFHFIAK